MSEPKLEWVDAPCAVCGSLLRLAGKCNSDYCINHADAYAKGRDDFRRECVEALRARELAWMREAASYRASDRERLANARGWAAEAYGVLAIELEQRTFPAPGGTGE